jgi:hypothetical protein
VADPTWKSRELELTESEGLELERRKRFVGQARSRDVAKAHRANWDAARLKSMEAARAAAEFSEMDDAGALY